MAIPNNVVDGKRREAHQTKGASWPFQKFATVFGHIQVPTSQLHYCADLRMSGVGIVHLQMIRGLLARNRTITLMAGLGGLAGLISAVVPDRLANLLKPVSPMFLLDDVSVHPGFLFGLVIALGVWWVGERRAWVIGLMVVTTMFAWSAALNTAFWIYEIKDVRVLFSAMPALPSSAEATAVTIFLTGFLAGIVGAAVMVFSCALVVPSLRGVVPIGLTILVGGVCGLLLYPFLGGWPLLEGWDDAHSLIVLFPIWQASIAACLGWAFKLQLQSRAACP